MVVQLTQRNSLAVITIDPLGISPVKNRYSPVGCGLGTCGPKASVTSPLGAPNLLHQDFFQSQAAITIDGGVQPPAFSGYTFFSIVASWS